MCTTHVDDHSCGCGDPNHIHFRIPGTPRMMMDPIRQLQCVTCGTAAYQPNERCPDHRARETPRAEETPRCPACDDTTVCGHDYHWGSVNAEITALRQQVKELERIVEQKDDALGELQHKVVAWRDQVKTRDEQIAKLTECIEERDRDIQAWESSHRKQVPRVTVTPIHAGEEGDGPLKSTDIFVTTPTWSLLINVPADSEATYSYGPRGQSGQPPHGGMGHIERSPEVRAALDRAETG